MKWKVGGAKLTLKNNLIVDLPDGAIPFNVELPQSYSGDGKNAKPAVEFDGVVYFIAPVKDV